MGIPTSDVTGDTDVDPEIERRRAALLTPALLATCVGIPLIILAVLLNVVMSILFNTQEDWMSTDGVTYLQPTAAERARIIAGYAVPAIAGVAFLVLTWRFRSRGRTAATWACAVLVVCMGFVAFW